MENIFNFTAEEKSVIDGFVNGTLNHYNVTDEQHEIAQRLIKLGDKLTTENETYNNELFGDPDNDAVDIFVWLKKKAEGVEIKVDEDLL